MANKNLTINIKEENVVQYFIFSNFHDLSNLQSKIFAFLSNECLLNTYIWQCDSFNLKRIDCTVDLPSHLYGRTYFGDNSEDEWYIVFLLLKLSKFFDDLFIRVVDEDGEFILIEAAENLPGWLEPETAENRVFLHKGEVHIVPHSQSEDDVIPVAQALKHIADTPNETRASYQIQRDVCARIEGYPGKVNELKHSANCYIPAKLAAILNDRPSLVSPIVRAFYERDELDLKGCVTFKHFQPGTRVMRRVQMTRCLYAQLLQQRFTPDPRSGFSLPNVNDARFKSHDLGMKLAHGAEILCRTAPSTSGEGKRRQVNLSDPRWLKFHESLLASGYFKDELPGSKSHSNLLAAANDFFTTSILPSLTGDDKADKTSRNVSSEDEAHVTRHVSADRVGGTMLVMLEDMTVDVEALKKEAESLESSDDDSWMDIGPAELDEMLNRYTREDKNSNRLNAIPDKIKSFVGQKSGHLGVELPESRENEVFFEPDTFMSALQKVFDFEDPKSSSSDSDLDEYASDADEQQELATRGNGEAATDVPSSMLDFMHLMDRELAGTEIGKSFASEHLDKVRQPSSKTSWATWRTSTADESTNSPRAKQPDSSEIKKFSSTSTNQSETRQTDIDTARKCFVKFAEVDDDDDDDDDEFKPIDVDMNLVENLLKSYSAQQGLAGPSSTVLNSLGLKLPPQDDDDDAS